LKTSCSLFIAESAVKSQSIKHWFLVWLQWLTKSKTNWIRLNLDLLLMKWLV